MAEDKLSSRISSVLLSGRADETLAYSKHIKDYETGKSVKQDLEERVKKTDQLVTDQLADSSVTTSKLADKSITNDKLDDKVVTTPKLQDSSVTTEKLNDHAVTTEKVADKSITNPKLADNSVDGRVIKSESVDTHHLANESVTTEKVKDQAITNDKMADGTLKIGKLAPELRRTIESATGLPEDLIQKIQDIDETLKDINDTDEKQESQINDNTSNIEFLKGKSDQLEQSFKDISVSGGASTANAVSYNNETSGLKAMNAQNAIDELAEKKFDKSSIAQELGNSSDKVISQKAIRVNFEKSNSLYSTIIKRISSSVETIISKDELLDGYIPISGGNAVIYGSYKHTKKIQLKKGECISAYLKGNDIAFISQTDDDMNYTPIVIAESSQAYINNIDYTAHDDIQVSLCTNLSDISYTIYSVDKITNRTKSQKALVIPYKGSIINYDSNKKTLSFPANWIISYVNQDGSLQNKYYADEQVVDLSGLRDQILILYNSDTELIEAIDYKGNVGKDCFVLFELSKCDGSFLVNLPSTLYSIDGIKHEDAISSEISSVNNKVSENAYRIYSIRDAISDKTQTNIELSWISGYYIDKKGGLPIKYDSYEISCPIKVSQGQVVNVTLKGTGISAISKTTLNESSPKEDLLNYPYESILGLDNQYNVTLTLNINEDCYIVFCRQKSDANPNCQVTDMTMISSKILKENIEELNKNNIPDFVMNEVEKTFKRFEKWKGYDKCCIFPIMTDLHPYLDDRYYSYITYMISSDKLFGYNFIANLGDFGDNITYDADGNAVSGDSDNADMSKTEEIDYGLIVKAAKKFGDWKGRLLFCQGNHDCVDNAAFSPKTFGRESVWNYMMMPTINRFPNEFKVNNKHQCGFYDDNENMIRFIFLNTSDNQKEDYDNGNVRKEYKITKEQLEWLIQALGCVPKGYGVVIFSHFCINRIGEWKSYPQTRVGQEKWAANGPYYEQGLGRILEGFANKTSGTDNESSYEYQNSNVSWDFSSLDDSCKLIAYICGDSHFDALLKKDDVFVTESGNEQIPAGISCPANGVNYLISQGYGRMDKTECHSKARYTEFNHDAIEQMLCDVVAIKTEKRIVKVFRIGAGGESCDREFSY